MASIVINESLRWICFNNSGIAVISLDFASVATWPKAIPSSLAQTLTMSNRTEFFGNVVGPPTRFAVDRDQPLRATIVSLGTMCKPVLKAPLERLGLQRHQQPTNAIA